MNGHWLSWSTWSECHGSPASATRERTRCCVHQNEGTPCENDNEKQIQTCESTDTVQVSSVCLSVCMSVCPSLVALGCDYEWSVWSPCSASCGVGVSLRTYKLRNSRSSICVPELKNKSRSCEQVPCRKGERERERERRKFSSFSFCRKISLWSDREVGVYVQ